MSLSKAVTARYIILLSLLLITTVIYDAALITPDFKQFSECNYAPPRKGTNIVLPKFAPEFELRTEFKRAYTRDSTYTVDFESTGYYQRNGSRGATITTSSGVEDRLVFDLQSGQAFSFSSSSPERCYPAKKSIFESLCSPFAYYVAQEAGFEFIHNKCNIRATNVTLVPELEPTYPDYIIERRHVRDIPVDKYKQCVWMAAKPGDNSEIVAHGGSYWLMEYYYGKKYTSYVQPQQGDRLERQLVPIRLNITRLVPDVDSIITTTTTRKPGIRHADLARSYEPHQLYDFFSYRGHIIDKSVFDPPPGVYCYGWRSQDGIRPLPQLPAKFSLATLFVSSKNKTTVTQTRLDFDFKQKVVLFLNDHNDRWMFTRHAASDIGDRHTILQDHKGWLAFDMAHNQCRNVMPIESESFGVASNNPYDPQKIPMIQANLIIAAASGDLNFTYMGQRQLNDMPAHVWIATKSDVVFSSQNDHEQAHWYNVELLFRETPDDPNNNYAAGRNSVFAQNNSKFVPAAMIIYKINYEGPVRSSPHKVEKLTSTVTFYGEDPILWKTFDINECMINSSVNVLQNGDALASIVLREKSPNGATRMPRMLGSRTALQATIARTMNLPPVRISNLTVLSNYSHATMKIWFAVLAWPRPNVPDAVDVSKTFNHTYVTPRTALERLNATINNVNKTTTNVDYVLKRNWATWNETFSVVRNSLRIEEDTTATPSNTFEQGIDDADHQQPTSDCMNEDDEDTLL